MKEELVKDASKRLFEPRQVGVGCSGGGEAVVQSVNAIVHEKGHIPDLALLKIDFRNAFNEVSRALFLKELDAEIPELSHWARWCYGSDSQLWFHDVIIDSSEGAQQGDPIASLLFSLALRFITKRIEERFPTLDLHVWYLDDGTVIGCRQDLAQLLTFLGGDDLKASGFDLNLGKCEVWWPSGDTTFLEFPQSIQRMRDGIDILKIPIGSDDYIERRLRHRVEKIKAVTTQLSSLEDSHIEFTILRACLGSAKLAYALRGLAPSDRVLTVLRDADEVLRLAFEKIIGDSVSAAAWKQAGLRPSMGGLGLRHAEDIAAPAFLGSTVETSELSMRLLNKESLAVPGLQQAAQDYIANARHAQVPLSTGLLVSVLATGLIDMDLAQRTPKKVQAALQEPIDDKDYETLKYSVGGNGRDRLEAVRRTHASAWISCFPNKNMGLHMPAREFRVACRSWLGLTSRAEAKAMLKPGIAMYGRHHAIQECLLSLCRSAGVPAKREILIDNSGQRPADVFLPNFSQGQPVAADVTVSHPSQAPPNPSDGAAPTLSASERAALVKSDLKNRKYKTQCDARGVAFMPVVVCSFGGWLPEGEELVHELANRSASRSGRDVATTKAQFWERLSIALWRGNARQLLHCLW